MNAGKAVFSLYEPIVVVYSLRNISDSEIMVPSNLIYGLGEVAFSIRGANGETIDYRNDVLARSIMAAKPVMLQAHQAETRDVVVFFNETSSDLAFPIAGHYVITGQVQVGNDPNPVLVRAEPLTIEVRDPTKRERQAIEALGSVNRLTALFRLGPWAYCKDEEVGACAETLRSFLRRYDDSPLAPAVTYYYGEAVSSGALPIGPKDDKAADVFAGFLRHWPDHPLEPSVIAALIVDLNKTGRRQESFEWLHRFEQKFPERTRQVRDLRARIE